MICKECEKRPDCTQLCDAAKLLMPVMPDDDAIDLADDSVELMAETTLDIQQALDLRITLENLGVRILDELTGLAPCKQYKYLRSKGLI